MMRHAQAAFAAAASSDRAQDECARTTSAAKRPFSATAPSSSSSAGRAVDRDRAQEALAHRREIDETEYVFAHNLRHVVPYRFTHMARAKQRWFGRTVVDVCADEFRNWDAAYFERAVGDGRIRVRDQRVGLEYVFRQHDSLRHDVHRHEPSVSASIINIVHETADLIVVSKPPSIPIHPCGRYRRNSLIYILEVELGMQFFRTFHISLMKFLLPTSALVSHFSHVPLGVSVHLI